MSSHRARILYLRLRAAALELNDEQWTSDFEAHNWQEYAVEQARVFRELDTLLIKGAPFPEEWGLGITTP